MSFEGYTVLLCAEGHRSVKNAYWGEEEEENVCKVDNCGEPFVWFQTVDETNGYDPNDPRTYKKELEVIGFDDVWNMDHYGNKYAVKILKYRRPSD